jgi:hypothetical protein
MSAPTSRLIRQARPGQSVRHDPGKITALEQPACSRCGADMTKSALASTITVHTCRGERIFIGSACLKSVRLCTACGLVLASWILSGRDGRAL